MMSKMAMIKQPSRRLLRSTDDLLSHCGSARQVISLRHQGRNSQADETKTFFAKLWDNYIKQKEVDPTLQKNIEKFREDRQRFEQSEGLQKAREKFDKIEAETKTATEKVAKAASSTYEDIKGSDAFKFASENINKASETVAKAGSKISSTDAGQAISNAARSAGEEFGKAAISVNHRVFDRGEGVAMKRQDVALMRRSEREFSANEDVADVELHKSSMLEKQWQSLRNSESLNKVFELKQMYDESDNLAVRAFRQTTERAKSFTSGLFNSNNDMAQTLTAISRIDSNFNKEEFLIFCRTTLVPNYLLSIENGDLSVIEDWSGEAVMAMLSERFESLSAINQRPVFKVLDIGRVDIVLGKVIDHGPVLVIGFDAHVVEYVEDSLTGEVVSGSRDDVMVCSNTWALCRDMEDFDPYSSWRILEMSMSSNKSFF